MAVGDDDHRLALIPLPDDFPPIHEQVRSREHGFVRELAAIPDTPPGAEAAFAVDLERRRVTASPASPSTAVRPTPRRGW